MMTEEQHIEWLLELQEHPEQLTDEQLRQILADDEMRQLVQQLGFAKRAFKHDVLKNDTPDVEGEWEKFAASHSEELEILDEGEYKPLHPSSVYFWLRALPLPLFKLCEISARPNRNSPQQSKRQTLIQSRPCPQIRLRPIQFPLSHTFSIMCHLTLCSQPLLQPTICRWSLRMNRLVSSVSISFGSAKTALRVL